MSKATGFAEHRSMNVPSGTVVIELATLDGLRNEVHYWRMLYAQANAVPPPPGPVARVRLWFRQHQVLLVGAVALIVGWTLGQAMAEVSCCDHLPARCSAPVRGGRSGTRGP